MYENDGHPESPGAIKLDIRFGYSIGHSSINWLLQDTTFYYMKYWYLKIQAATI